MLALKIYERILQRMKNILFFLILLGLVSCNKNIEPVSPTEKFFDPVNINNLALENLTTFWKGDNFETKLNTIDFTIYFLTRCEGYLKGIELSNDKKGIGVYVFDTKSNAIEAMDNLIGISSAFYYEGEKQKIINEKWWYIKGDPYYSIFINRWNTIVNILHKDPSDEETIFGFIKEITKRIDFLCD